MIVDTFCILPINGTRSRLASLCGIYHLFHIGRLNIAVNRTPVWSRTLNKYRSGVGWTSWNIGWLRIYWWDKGTTLRFLFDKPFRS